jgi:excisionase family DNA binding protein
MLSRIAVPLPDGRWLALTPEQFAEAAQAGRELIAGPTPTPHTGPSEDLLTAAQLAQRTGIPASWWEQAAREERVPHARIGRYVRFRFQEVAEHFSRPLDSDSLGALRHWRKSIG